MGVGVASRKDSLSVLSSSSLSGARAENGITGYGVSSSTEPGLVTIWTPWSNGN